MSDSAKQLQMRFVKIRSENRRKSKFIAGIMTIAIVMTAMCATVVMAAIDNKPKNFFINDKGYNIMPVLIENNMGTHTDSFYVPLRDTMEALGYEVAYDVDKTSYERYMGIYNFPLYENNYMEEFYDDVSNEVIYISNITYYEWLKGMVTNSADMYIYGSTGRMNKQMPIIEMSKNGVVEYCQIGSDEYSSGYALAPVLLGNKTYIPLRAVANIVGGIDTVKWNEAKHDTYFEGALRFDEETMSVFISIAEEG